MTTNKPMLRIAGTVLALTTLTAALGVPASAHHCGGHHSSTAVTTVYCQTCEDYHAKGSCPSACASCGLVHSGDCATSSHTSHRGHGRHRGHC